MRVNIKKTGLVVMFGFLWHGTSSGKDIWGYRSCNVNVSLNANLIKNTKDCYVNTRHYKTKYVQGDMTDTPYYICTRA